MYKTLFYIKKSIIGPLMRLFGIQINIQPKYNKSFQCEKILIMLIIRLGPIFGPEANF